MKVELAKYSNKRICVAVSGGKDSMALLHYFSAHARECGIDLCALNCDHGIRGETSAADSAFVKKYCEDRGIPLLFFKNDDDTFKRNESLARSWRLKCYVAATVTQTLEDGTLWKGADAVATAHHLSDNAETVLFNIARGSGLSGAAGITDTFIEGIGCPSDGLKTDTVNLNIIHPLIAASREEIDEYIAQNNIPYVTDESNLTDDYTRNKIRHGVIPALEDAVPGAQRAIYRFSRIAAETEQYFNDLITKNSIISSIYGGYLIKFTDERAVFSRAALKVFASFELKDYTQEHISRLYEMQFCGNGKKFEFLGITARKEAHGISLCRENSEKGLCEINFRQYINDGTKEFCGEIFVVLSQLDGTYARNNEKLLKFDGDKIPGGAVIRVMRKGDKFTKFGGGTKSLGDYFTDKKIPARLRGAFPLVADGNNVLIIGGVEISDSVKITEETKNIYGILCRDYKKM